MFARLSFVTLALVGMAGVAHAQPMSSQPMGGPSASMQYGGGARYQAMMPDGGSYPAAITDEYGFRYNAQGDRLDARGHIMPPPVTPPGTPALR